MRLQTLNKKLKPLAVAMASSLLLACGGGSSDGSGNSQLADISGSGLTMGSVDGFGSVIVNGVHYDTDSADFSINEQLGSQADLHVGQWVVIDGSRSGAEGVAETVSYERAVVGPISSVDSDSGLMVVLGQTVLADALTVFHAASLQTLAVGDIVEVSGIRNGSETLVAGFISMAVDSGDVEVHGEVGEHDSELQTFVIGGQLVDYSLAGQLKVAGGAIADGMLLEVEGRLQGAVLIASEIEQEGLALDADTDLDIEGRISGLDSDAGRFKLSGLTVVFDGATDFDDGSAAELTDSMLVEVEGVIDTDGLLQADSIELEADAEQELLATVTAVNGDLMSLLGVEVMVDSHTRFSDERDALRFFSLADVDVGDRLELVLSKRQGGGVQALKLARVDAAPEAVVIAEVQAFDSQSRWLELLGQRYDLSVTGISFGDDGALTAPEFFAQLSVGGLVELVGSEQIGVFVIGEVLLQD